MLLAVCLIVMVTLSSQTNIQNMTLLELNSTVSTADNVLVIAVDSSQKKSKTFLKTIDDFASKLSQAYPKLQLRLVDNDEPTSENDLMFERFDIINFPTAILFKKGIKITMASSMKFEALQKALDKRLAAGIVEVKTLVDLEKNTSDNHTVYFYTQDSQVQGWFEGLAARYTQFKFIKASNRKIIEDFALKHGQTIAPGSSTVALTRRHHDYLV